VRSAEDFIREGADPGSKRSLVVNAVGQDGTERTRWLASELARRINEVLRLPPNWDGEGAEPVTDDAVQAAVDVTSRLVDEHSIPPFVIALVDGGIQLEWHAGPASVEIEIDRLGVPHVLVADETGAIVENHEFATLSPPESVKVALRQVTARLLATV
jgi:hypothetical protein